MSDAWLDDIYLVQVRKLINKACDVMYNTVAIYTVPRQGVGVVLRSVYLHFHEGRSVTCVSEAVLGRTSMIWNSKVALGMRSVICVSKAILRNQAECLLEFQRLDIGILVVSSKIILTDQQFQLGYERGSTHVRSVYYCSHCRFFHCPSIRRIVIAIH